MRGHPRWFKIRTRRVYKRSSRPDPPQTPLHSGSIMSLVDSSNNYNSNGQQPGYLASRHLMVQDLASRHPTLLKQLNSPPTICKCSGQSRLVSCPTRWNFTTQITEYKHKKNFNYRQRSKTNKLIFIFLQVAKLPMHFDQPACNIFLWQREPGSQGTKYSAPMEIEILCDALFCVFPGIFIE